MKVVLQRVQNAKVTVDEKTVGEIGAGYLILLGICDEDTAQTVEKMVDKIKKLRIFEDSDGKTNLSIDDAGGEILVVSQFTLYADCKK
ncbi:MAG: D-tyrosyl-tRNA(Tyr) deacylase, partial [Clostridiaceae bacterium]|nr:D-tyrosyl-tRNA(Tyr) deacylase [Clostridiaceae bacterium]